MNARTPGDHEHPTPPNMHWIPKIQLNKIRRKILDTWLWTYFLTLDLKGDHLTEGVEELTWPLFQRQVHIGQKLSSWYICDSSEGLMTIIQLLKTQSNECLHFYKCVNPLHPKISMYILHTFLCTSPINLLTPRSD